MSAERPTYRPLRLAEVFVDRPDDGTDPGDGEVRPGGPAPPPGPAGGRVASDPQPIALAELARALGDRVVELDEGDEPYDVTRFVSLWSEAGWGTIYVTSSNRPDQPDAAPRAADRRRPSLGSDDTVAPARQHGVSSRLEAPDRCIAWTSDKGACLLFGGGTGS